MPISNQEYANIVKAIEDLHVPLANIQALPVWNLMSPAQQAYLTYLGNIVTDYGGTVSGTNPSYGYTPPPRNPLLPPATGPILMQPKPGPLLGPPIFSPPARINGNADMNGSTSG